MTRWTVAGDADSWVVRWLRNVVNGEIEESGSVKSRVCRVDVGTNLIWADEGRMRRLLRSKS